LGRRLEEHNSKEKNKYTSKFSGQWISVYKEELFDWKTARQRENFFKRQKSKEYYKRICKENYQTSLRW
jgi:predicted GIY-YIG superfamily endonuclease